jgi:hypothetical protein
MKRHVLLGAVLVVLLLVAAPIADGHSHWWKQHHPWRGTGWKQDALCVHRYEGSWVDPGAPYYGGMQMDLPFQSEYGPWQLHHLGTADRWSVNGQLYASWKAWRVRGWAPWPNTARYCGLL